MLNTAPNHWTISDLVDEIRMGPITSINGKIVPVRPYGEYSLRSRLRLAWMVFTGRADALEWPRQMPKAY